MKRALLAATVAVVALGGTAASAQNYNQYDRREDRQERREDRREYREDRREYREDLRENHRDYRHAQRWARGQVLPYQYRTRSYIVSDYGRYRLSAPPRGYHYVRYGNDALLTAVASGLIASVLTGVFSQNQGYAYQQQPYGYGQSYGYQQPYGYSQSYGYAQPVIRGYDRYGRPIY